MLVSCWLRVEDGGRRRQVGSEWKMACDEGKSGGRIVLLRVEALCVMAARMWVVARRRLRVALAPYWGIL